MLICTMILVSIFKRKELFCLPPQLLQNSYKIYLNRKNTAIWKQTKLPIIFIFPKT